MRPLSTSLSVLETYKFALVTIVGFVGSFIFSPVIGEPLLDIIFYLNAIGALLCLLLFLQEIWLTSDKQEKVRLYLWYITLTLCLPLVSTLILIRSDHSVYWTIHFILANILLLLLVRNTRVFYILLAVGLSSGFILGSVLNLYAKAESEAVFADLALYSCACMLLRIVFVIHDRMYVDKHMYKLVEKVVQDRTKDLSAALAVKDEFLDNIGHELRIPLHNSSNLLSELYNEWNNLPDETRLAFVGMVRESNARLHVLYSNLLDLSQFRKGYMVRLKKCNPVLLIEETLAEYRKFAHLISVKISPDVDVIYCDKEKISQVLHNLLDNAVKYGGAGAIEIDIEKRDEKDILFSVSDEGVGIPEQELESIFKPFEQSSRTKTRAGGTGLGLSICEKVIEYHRGRLWAKNNKKRGATFFFTIPRGTRHE
jgi:signal transduction histidine kinase